MTKYEAPHMNFYLGLSMIGLVIVEAQVVVEFLKMRLYLRNFQQIEQKISLRFWSVNLTENSNLKK